MTHPNRAAMLEAAATHARSLAAAYGRPPLIAEYNATRPDGLPAASTLRLIYEIPWSAVIAAAVRDPSAEAEAATLRAAVEAEPTVRAAAAAIVEIGRSLGKAPIHVRDYNRHRPKGLPSTQTLIARYGAAWGLLVDLADRLAAEQPTPQPLPAGEIVTVPPPVVTGNVSSEPEPPARPAPPAPPARALAEIESDPLYAGLPQPQRDPLTGQLRPPRDCNGFAVWRVRVAPHEQTCLSCGETFTPDAGAWYEAKTHTETEGGCCQRCRAASHPPAIPTAAYIRAEERRP